MNKYVSFLLALIVTVGVFGNGFIKKFSEHKLAIGKDASAIREFLFDYTEDANTSKITVDPANEEINMVGVVNFPEAVNSDALLTASQFVVQSTTNGATPCPRMTNAQRDLLTPVKGQCVYSDTDNIHYQYDGTVWTEMGGGAGGGLDTWFIENYEKLLIADWFTGNNATFLGGGALSGTLTLETTNPLAGDVSFKYTMGPSSANDYIASPVITLDDKQKNNDSGLTTYFTYNGADDDIKLVVWDVTNSKALTSTLELVKNKGSPTRYVTTFYPSATTASIQYGFHVLVGDNLKELIFDDTELSVNPFVYKEINRENNFSMKVSSAGVVSDENTDWINGNCTVGGGIYSCPTSSGFFTTVPNCFAIYNTDNVAAANIKISTSITASSVDIFPSDAAGTSLNSSDGLNIFCQRSGDDYGQTTEHVVTPAKAGVNTFTAKVSKTQVVSEENVDFITGNCSSGSGAISCTLNTGQFSLAPICTGVIDNPVDQASSFYFSSSTSTSSVVKMIPRDAAASSLALEDMILVCHRSGSDFKDTAYLAAVPVQKVAFINVDASNFHTSLGSTTSYKTQNLDSLSGNSSFLNIDSNQLTIPAGEYVFTVPVGVNGSAGWIDFLLYNITDLTNEHESLLVVYGNNTNFQPFTTVSFSVSIVKTTTFEFRTKAGFAGHTEAMGRISITKLR